MKTKTAEDRDLLQKIIHASEQIPTMFSTYSSTKVEETLEIVQVIQSFLEEISQKIDFQSSLVQLQFLQEINKIFLQKQSQYFDFLFQSFCRKETAVYTHVGQKTITSIPAVIKTLA